MWLRLLISRLACRGRSGRTCEPPQMLVVFSPTVVGFCFGWTMWLRLPLGFCFAHFEARLQREERPHM